jgi:hypothetical protein
VTAPDEELAYASFKPCGCLAMVVMQGSKSAAPMVADAVKHRERIESMTAAAVRAMPFKCPEHKKPVAV